MFKKIEQNHFTLTGFYYVALSKKNQNHSSFLNMEENL